MNSPAENGVSVDVDQNEFLAEGTRTMDAVVTVQTSDELAVAAPPQQRVEILIIDCSGSMGGREKFPNARTATLAALDVMPDGTHFAIVKGTDTATVVYPTQGASAVANRESRAAARRALDKLKPDGGTAIGTWLGVSRMIAQKHPGAMVHAILLTDGKNEHETAERLAEEIRASEGLFTCDCRGVGSDWEPEELRAIASALHGTVDIVKTADLLAKDFAAMMESSMEKTIPELKLRVWTPVGARIVFLKQVAPAIENLTARRVETAPQIGEYPLGAWGADERDYHIKIDIDPLAPGGKKLAARISVFTDADPLAQGLVKAEWTTDTDLSAPISRGVAHYTGQAELAQVVQEGLAARKAGDNATATQKLQRAMHLAHESGNDNTAKLLRGVVDVDDAGTVRLRAHVDPSDEIALNVRSSKTARVRPEDRGKGDA
ncbi:VWA domain-containing protein [Nocardia sp. NPDC088792]|uniref:vWA domain-containing protein n=1 Tax=Nocardia sp. NPDC088792 TaxID=3364332 RepID=UPI0037FE5D2F